MVKTVSEHVTPLAEDRPAAQAIAPRAGPAAARPPQGRPPADDYVHPGVRLAVWVWVLGFSALFLQVISEGVIVLVMAALHR